MIGDFYIRLQLLSILTSVIVTRLPHLTWRAFTGGNPDSNTLISDMTTVICLDDYHCLDRNGRKEKGVTALAPEAQNFDLMYQQVGMTCCIICCCGPCGYAMAQDTNHTIDIELQM
jgi:hypothetical protein